MDSLFDPTCVPVRVTINKLNFFPNRKVPRFINVVINLTDYILQLSLCYFLEKA